VSYDQGLDLRSTQAYGDGIDPANCDYVILGRGLYPWTTAQGNTVGWETTQPQYFRDDYGDTLYGTMKLTGSNYVYNGSTRNLRLDLPASGSYTVTLAIGGGIATHGTAVVLDTSTTLATIGPLAITTTPPPSWADASGNIWTGASTSAAEAAWVAGQVPITLTFATTICRIQLIASGGYMPLCHVRVTAAAPSVYPPCLFRPQPIQIWDN